MYIWLDKIFEATIQFTNRGVAMALLQANFQTTQNGTMNLQKKSSIGKAVFTLVVQFITVRDQNFLGMQDFDFAKFLLICPNLITFSQISPQFSQI